MPTLSLFDEEIQTPAEPEPDPLKEKMLEIHERLCALYECPIPYFHDLDPLDELVSSLLSHRTKNADSSRAFRTLKARFSDWQAVLEAPIEAVQDAISAATWPEQKAPRLQFVLREIQKRTGHLSLDFLEKMEPTAARKWLQSISGVGPKTSAAVLAFSRIRGRALPVDSHHHRVAQRVGLIPFSLDVGPSHAVLEAMLPGDWNAQQVYDNHEIFMLHGQRICHHHAPKCGECVLLDLCPSGQARLKHQKPRESAA